MRAQLCLAVTAALAIGSPALAQDFLGGLARGLARSSAEAVADRAAQAVTQPRPSTGSAPASTSAPVVGASQAPSSQSAASPVPHPIPTNLSPTLRTPGEFKFSQADEDAKKAFEDFGKIPCNSCEGGFSFDTWPEHQIPGMFGKVFGHLWGLSVGESLRWTGSGGGAYAITIASDHPVNGFPCKQLDYTGHRDEQSAGYRGLICRTDNGGSMLF